MKEIDLNILEELRLFKPTNPKVRLGKNYDSGYVIADGYNYDLYISGGIADAVSFDNDFNQKYPETKGICFDGSCQRPSSLTGNYDYFLEYIGSDKGTLLHEYIGGYENIFIKLDIEGSEWDWIIHFDHLDKVKQMVIEGHGFFDKRTGPEGWQSIGCYKYEQILEALKKINKTHYLVHIHGNNAGGSYDPENDIILETVISSGHLPVVFEMTFIRKKDCSISGYNKDSLPIVGIDYPNYYTTDFRLDYYPFVKNNYFSDFFSNQLHNNSTLLCEIMNKEGSDKGSGHHNYTTFYNYLFSEIRGQVVNVFELGLGTNNPIYPCNMSGQGVPCSSLRGWREYFPNAQVYGADIDRDILFQEDRLTTFYCDQLDATSIENMWSAIPQQFDLILEDGLHTFEANKNFLLNSLHKVKKGGFFVVEDIHHNDFSKFQELIETLEAELDLITLVKIPNQKNDSDNNLLLIKK